jgi:hypothetical protein
MFLTLFWFIGACKTSSIELIYGVFGASFMLFVILPLIKRRYIPKENEEH